MSGLRGASRRSAGCQPSVESTVHCDPTRADAARRRDQFDTRQRNQESAGVEFAYGHRALQAYGLWVFDDLRVGLEKESFIAGIDTMIDKMTAPREIYVRPEPKS